MDTEAMREQALALWNTAWSYATDATSYLDQFRLLTPSQANYIVFAASVALAVPVIYLVMRRSEGRFRIVVSGMTIPAFLLLMLQVPSGYRGTPDDRCGDYEGGKLNFVLITTSTTPIAADDIYGGRWLLLLVRAPERWGNDPHQCRLNMSDERVQKLYEAIRSYGDGFASNGRGVIHFNFGSKAEFPNVRFRPDREAPGKTGPPEVPREKQRDT